MLLYIMLGVIGLVVVLIFTGNKSVHHEIVIEASPNAVWDIIMNMEDYPEWNPVMELLQGEVKAGSKVKYRFTQEGDNTYDITADIVEVISNQMLNQKGGIPLVLTYNHKYILEAVGKSTKVIIHEDYKGIGVNFWNPEPVEKAYGRLNEALKKRAE